MIKKLQIRPGSRKFVLGKPRGLGLGVTASRSGQAFGIVFVRSREDVERTALEATRRIEEDGLLWYCYPKQSSGVETDINRDRGWNALIQRGFRGVRQISIDSTWSALRLRDRRFVRNRKG